MTADIDDPGVSARCVRCQQWKAAPAALLFADAWVCEDCRRKTRLVHVQRRPVFDRTSSPQARAVSAAIAKRRPGGGDDDAAA